MNTLSAKLALTSLLMAATALGADPSPTGPAYPHQPSINRALKQLTEAQKIVTAAGSKQEDVVPHLNDAHIALQNAIKDKGSFRATAIRLTGQAIKHLEKGDKDSAAHEIEEAIEAVNKAGKAGAN
jgi:hypothetical protein